MDGRAQAVSRSWVSEEVLSLLLGQKKKKKCAEVLEKGNGEQSKAQGWSGQDGGAS